MQIRPGRKLEDFLMKSRLIVATSTESSDLLYATGFWAPDPVVFFSTGRTRALVVSSLEYNRAREQATRGIEVFRNGDFASGKRGGGFDQILVGISRKFGVSNWDVPPFFPLQYADSLRKESVEVRCGSGVFFPSRERKTGREQAEIRRAVKLAELAMRKALDMIRAARVDSEKRLTLKGNVLTSERVRTEIDIEILRGGGGSQGTIVSCGPHAAQPHHRGEGPLRANEPIVLDIFPRLTDSGYWGDMTRTVVKGRPKVIVRRAFDAVLRARDEAKTRIRAGISASASFLTASKILAEAGFQTGRDRKTGLDHGFIHSLGHGVGLDIHEGPRLAKTNDALLKRGSVVTVEPGLYYPKWGGVRLEDLVVVTESGCETLTQFETELEIA
jgi:Xaa-Pro aminopeptidase